VLALLRRRAQAEWLLLREGGSACEGREEHGNCERRVEVHTGRKESSSVLAVGRCATVFVRMLWGTVQDVDVMLRRHMAAIMFAR
jgi:hypothetical protein